MISAVLNRELEQVEYNNDQIFGLNMPISCPNVPSSILNPKKTWIDKEAYDNKANELAQAFNKNFDQFANNANKEILSAAPKVKV